MAAQAGAQDSPDYIKWLESGSRLEQAKSISATVSGSGTQWRNSYAEPKSMETPG